MDNFIFQVNHIKYSVSQWQVNAEGIEGFIFCALLPCIYNTMNYIYILAWHVT